MSDLPVAFHDLSSDAFPFRIEMFDVDTGLTYEVIDVEGPGAVRINPKPQHVRRAGTRVRYANGEVVTQE